MAYDEQLAGRVRDCIRGGPGFTEKAMFGGLGFLLRGHMCVAVWKDSLVVRVGPDAYDAALRSPFVREFDITGRAMTGWVLVGPEGVADEADVQEWLGRAVAFVDTLPPKSPKPSSRAPRRRRRTSS